MTRPNEELKVGFLEALAELEDHECHRTRKFPKTRLHRVVGYKQPVYTTEVISTRSRAGVCTCNIEDGQIHLKDIIEGQKHDDVLQQIEAKKVRYERKLTGRK